MVLIGRVVRPQGNRGEVVVASETDFGAERFQPGAKVHTLRHGPVEVMTVTSSREHDGRWVVGFSGVSSIDDAEALRGLELRIPADDLRALHTGTHYVHDLVGCRVETIAGEAAGTVRDVQFGSGSPLLVAEAAGEEVLIPFTSDVCRRVDTAARLIVIDPPEGLLELNKRKGSID